MKGQDLTQQGIVAAFRRNPKGDVDGLTLDGGRDLRFPPHRGDEVAALVSVGDEVTCAGHEHTDPRGRVHVHLERITLAGSGKSLTLDDPPSKPPRRGDKAPQRGKIPHPDHVPHHEQMLAEIRAVRVALGGDDEPTGGDGHRGPPHEQVLRALRSLRTLAERGARPS